MEAHQVQQPFGWAESWHCNVQDQEAQIARKKRRATTRTQARSIAGTSLEVIHCRRHAVRTYVCLFPCHRLTRLCRASTVCAHTQVINKRRAEKPEVRKASREAALREVICLVSSYSAARLCMQNALAGKCHPIMTLDMLDCGCNE